MRRIPIRLKLAIALSVPLIAVGLVTLIEVISVANEAADVRDQSSLATATIGPNGLITALQNERNFTAAQLVGADETLDLEVHGYEANRGIVDAARTEFEAGLGDEARAAYAPALRGLEELAALRSEIDTHAGSPGFTPTRMALASEFFASYTGLIEPFFGGMARISIAMDDPELRHGAELMETVTRQLEITPQLTNAIALPTNVPTGDGDVAGINRPDEIAKIAELQDTFRRQAEALRTAGDPFADVAEEFYPAEFTATVDAHATQGITTGAVDYAVMIEDLKTEPDEQLPYSGYQDAIAARIEDRADQLASAADDRQLRFGLLMAATFAAAVALTVLVSLSITRPLRSLTRQAKDMAERRLPGAVTEILDVPLGDDVVVPQVAPVKVGTSDEVADVADALNKVQDSALDLALEQAVLRRNIADSFVNLGRRNQNLLGRQLDFITELESKEADPDTLSSLFRLDHLATRMRRNAESLLVLAGIEPPRQWAAPVRITDVVRAALGEVENYERVTVRGVAPATVQGSAAADLAHLLAELIENALVFSPPDQTVDIRGAAQRAGHQAGYTIAIMDAGLGMPAEDIEAANRRLAGVESFTVAPSKYLGHYVAGNLAARHGIRVHLRSSPGTGIVATVELPTDLLTPDTGTGPGPTALATEQRHLAAAPAAIGASRTSGGLGPAAADRARGSMAPTEDQWASLADWSSAGQGQSWPAPGEHARPAAARAPQAPWQGPPPGGYLAPQAPPQPAPAAQWQPQADPRQAQQQPDAWQTQPQPDAWQTQPQPQPDSRQAQRQPDSWQTQQQPQPDPWPAQQQSPGAWATQQTPQQQPSARGAQPPLARRERGAQLPSTKPTPIRSTPRADTATGQPAAQPPVHRPRAAEEVYGFLSSFTAGVQRGLDASRAPGD